MLAARRFQLPRRPLWQLSRHHVHQRSPSRRSNRTHRVAGLPSPPRPSPESTSGLKALFATMCGIQLYSSPLTGSFESADFVARHFEASRSKLQSGQFYTLFTSTLYTREAGSAFLNLFWLGFAGRHVCRAMGNTQFLLLYVGSGALANRVSMMSGREFKSDPKLQVSGGASCAVDCIVTLNALMYPPSRVALTRQWMRWPLWFFSILFLTRDEEERPPWEPDSAPRLGHVVGVLSGLGAFLALRRPPLYI